MMEYLTEEGPDLPSPSKLQEQVSFDQYLNEQLKNGPAQTRLSCSLFIMLFSEGSESIVLGLIIPVLVHEWHITTLHKSLLITAVYVGVSLGSALQTVADHFGRYSVITLAGVIQTAAGLLSAMAGEFSFFLFVRFVYGVGIGIVLPLSATFVSEITPTKDRAERLSFSRVIWNLGTILTCVLSYFLLDGYERGEAQWRMLLLLVCLPGVMALGLHLTYGRESPRYLLLKGKYEEAREIMKEMEMANQVEELSGREFEKIKRWAAKQEEKHGGSIPFSKLMDSKYKWITIKLMVAWFTVCFIYYGIMLLLPLILVRNFGLETKSNLMIIFVVSSFQLLAFAVSSSIMNHPSYGRQNTTRYSFLTCFLTSVLLFIFDTGQILFALLFIVIKFAVTLAFMTLYPYTTELYHTLLRSKAMGVTSLVGRLATVLLGVVGVYALEMMGGKLLYLIFMVFGLLSYVAMTAMPYDTLGKDLDHH